MPKELAKLLEKYDYELPPELIANKPASPRDSAKLLAYDRKSAKLGFDTFKNLAAHLPKNAVLVFNQTKVWPARLIAKKPTGGKVELLYISNDKTHIKTLANRQLTVGTALTLVHGKGRGPQLKLVKRSGQFYFFEPSFSISRLPQTLKAFGVTPLPPYIKNSPLSEAAKRQQYQAVFAKNGMSVAAPTASLHFTKKLIADLKKHGVSTKFIRLDVGLGTFAPLRSENIDSGKLHHEFFKIDGSTASFLNLAKKEGRPIIAVGTTVVRTLESACRNGKVSKLNGDTDLFIREGYKFQFVDGLITNFHVPRSSLLMLVSALAGRKTVLKLYDKAIAEKFRFFSFGDGMLIT